MALELAKTWLNHQRAEVSQKARLDGKLAYIANHWKGRQVFLTDGRVEVDSNAVENSIRPIALKRKTRCSPAMTPSPPAIRPPTLMRYFLGPIRQLQAEVYVV